MAKKINPLVLSYPTFTLGQIIDPEEVNQNNMDITNKVNEFVSEVETAISIAESADASSLNAINVANQSSTKSDSAVSTANNASNKSDNAVVVANNAQSVADNAKLTAENVQTDYNALKPSLTQAIVDAGNAVNIANSADGKANTALSNSNTAISTANSADGKANNAVTTSNQAKDVADSASIVANQAKGIAESTDIVADNAMNKATSVETDFNTLRPQLEQAVIDVNNAVVAVTNKVDKSYVDDLVADIILGEIPDGSVTKQKLSTSLQNEIDDKLLLGITSTTAFQGDLGQEAYDHSKKEHVNVVEFIDAQRNIENLLIHNHANVYEPKNANIQTHITSTHAPSNAQKNSDITKAEIEAKLIGKVSSHSHDYAVVESNLLTKYQVTGFVNFTDYITNYSTNKGLADNTKYDYCLQLIDSDYPYLEGVYQVDGFRVNSINEVCYVNSSNANLGPFMLKKRAGIWGTSETITTGARAPYHQVGTTAPSSFVGEGVLYGVY